MPSVPMLTVGMGIPAPAGGFCATAAEEKINVNKAVPRVNEPEGVVGALYRGFIQILHRIPRFARRIATNSGIGDRQPWWTIPSPAN